jgi:hypothetical protein
MISGVLWLIGALEAIYFIATPWIFLRMLTEVGVEVLGLGV